jgi:glycosyltransferase involved in cell wall biosynthesis
MNVFALPSYREGFPRTLMEASAMGVPCVATDIRGCRESVRDGVNGSLVPVRDSIALAGAITKIVGSRDLAASLAAGGLREARTRFDERLIFEKVRQTYLRLLKACGHAAPEAALQDNVERALRRLG